MNDRYGSVRGLLVASAFLGNITMVLMPLFVRNIARDLELQVAFVGALVAGQGVVVGVISLLTGPISDRVGRKAVLGVALAANAAAAFAFAQSWSGSSLFVLGILYSVCFGPLTFSALGYAGDYFPISQRGAVVGLITGAQYAGVVIGAPMGVLMMEHPEYGWRSMFQVVAGISAVVTVVLSLVLPNVRVSAMKAAGIQGIIQAFASILRNAVARRFLVLFFLLRVGVGIYLVYASAYLFSVRAFPPSGIAIVYPIGGVLAFFASAFGGWFAGKMGARLLATLASVLISASVLMFVHVPTEPTNIVANMIAICSLYMVSEALRMSALHTEALSLMPAETRGVFLGCTSFVVFLGYALGAAVGGVLLDSFAARTQTEALRAGFPFLVYVAASLWMVVAVLTYRAGAAARRNSMLGSHVC